MFTVNYNEENQVELDDDVEVGRETYVQVLEVAGGLLFILFH